MKMRFFVATIVVLSLAMFISSLSQRQLLEGTGEAVRPTMESNRGTNIWHPPGSVRYCGSKTSYAYGSGVSESSCEEAYVEAEAQALEKCYKRLEYWHCPRGNTVECEGKSVSHTFGMSSCSTSQSTPSFTAHIRVSCVKHCGYQYY